MESIAMINQKGGVGKTVCTANLAACFDRDMKKKVLMVDCDSQCNLTRYMATFMPEEPELSVREYIKEECTLKDVAYPVFEETARHTVGTKMYIVPGTREMDYLDVPDREVFKKLLQEAYEMKFDYVFFDCPANLTLPTLICLNAVEYILIPISGDVFSLDGYSMLIDTVQTVRKTTNIYLKILGLFFNNMRMHESLDKYIYDDNVENLGKMLFKNYIRASAIVKQAQMYGKPVTYFKPTSDVCGDYKSLAREIDKRIKKGVD